MSRKKIIYFRCFKDPRWFISVEFEWREVDGKLVSGLEQTYNFIRNSRTKPLWSCKFLPVYGFSCVRYPTQHQFHYFRNYSGKWSTVSCSGSYTIVKPTEITDNVLPMVQLIYSSAEDQVQRYGALNISTFMGNEVLTLDILEFLYKEVNDGERTGDDALSKEKMSTKHQMKLKQRMSMQANCVDESKLPQDCNEPDINAVTAQISALTIHDYKRATQSKTCPDSDKKEMGDVHTTSASCRDTCKTAKLNSGTASSHSLDCITQNVEHRSTQKQGPSENRNSDLGKDIGIGRGRGRGRGRGKCPFPQIYLPPANSEVAVSDASLSQSDEPTQKSKNSQETDTTLQNAKKREFENARNVTTKSIGTDGNENQETALARNAVANPPKNFLKTESKGVDSMKTSSSNLFTDAGRSKDLKNRGHTNQFSGESNPSTKYMHKKSHDNPTMPADNRNELPEVHKLVEPKNATSMNSLVDSPSQNTRSKTSLKEPPDNTYASVLKNDTRCSANSKGSTIVSPYLNVRSKMNARFGRGNRAVEVDDFHFSTTIRSTFHDNKDGTPKDESSNGLLLKADDEKLKNKEQFKNNEQWTTKSSKGLDQLSSSPHQGTLENQNGENVSSNRHDIWSETKIRIIVFDKETLRIAYQNQGKALYNVAWLKEYGSDIFWFRKEKVVLKGLESLLSVCQTDHFKRVLVVGKPNFGKSLLCSLIPLYWAEHGVESIELCFSLTAEDLQNFDNWLDVLVMKIRSLHAHSYLDDKTLKGLLEEAADKILIVVDGLDELGPDDQNMVLSSMTDADRLGKSYVLATSRPLRSADMRDHFQFCAEISGFEDDIFKELAQKCARHKHDFNSRLEEFRKNSKLGFLNGFPLKYVPLAVNSFARNNPMHLNLFDVLYSFMLEVARELTFNQIEGASRKLGRICLNALQIGYLRITKGWLESIAGEYFPLIWELGAFVEPRNCAQDFLECPRVLVVFFATLYLRHLWDRALTEEDKSGMLQEEFCCGGSIGDIVMDSSSKVRYFAGIFPEVVLKVELDGNRLFEMYYDVNCDVEKSSAFDSVNLLLRLNQKFLPRFGFEESDECKLQETFANVINLFEFDGTVSMSFFSNAYEGRDFLVWNVEGRENEDTVLQGIVVKNMSKTTLQYDQLYLSFLASEIDKLWNFVLKVLNVPFSDESCKSPSLISLVKLLILVLETGKERRILTFGISGTSLPPVAISSVTCEIVSVFFHSTERQGVFYNLICKPTSIESDIVSNFGQLLLVIDKACQSFSNPLISIHMK